MLVTLVMLATCFGLLCGIGILFGIVGLLLKFGGKVLGACATILLPIGVIWLGFKIVFAVVPLLFKLVCQADLLSRIPHSAGDETCSIKNKI